jgi:hypothetical protein
MRPPGPESSNGTKIVGSLSRHGLRGRKSCRFVGMLLLCLSLRRDLVFVERIVSASEGM